MAKKLDIKINQSIISILGRKLYQSQFGMVVLRELIQNSLDANSSIIKVEFDSENKILSVIDNGAGIERIEGLLDTIGESIKDSDNLETIGGYGLAKLAIFGCLEWEFVSKSGSFSTGYIFDETKKQDIGTSVTCIFKSDDLPWDFESKIKDYLKSIYRNVTFFYNHASIKANEYKNTIIGTLSEVTSNTINNGYAIVRINGLPTFARYVPNLGETVFYDYQVSCDPYDDNYPLSSNRDGFIESSKEYADFQLKIKTLQKALETEKKLQENIAKQSKLIKFRNKQYISGGSITLEDYKNHSMTISTYERYIKQIGEIFYWNSSELEECSYGLTDSSDNELGMYSPSEKVFFISKNVEDKGQILSIAMHEFCHFLGYGMVGHDQSFTSKLGEITGRVLSDIFNGHFRK